MKKMKDEEARTMLEQMKVINDAHPGVLDLGFADNALRWFAEAAKFREVLGEIDIRCPALSAWPHSSGIESYQTSSNYDDVALAAAYCAEAAIGDIARTVLNAKVS